MSFSEEEWRAGLGRLEKEMGIMDKLRADIAKAQARCAELEAALSGVSERFLCGAPCWCIDGRDEPGHGDYCLDARRALASDGTSALAAVRLMQRLVKMVTPPKERPADLGLNRREKLALEVEKALAEAFGSGE